jgi:hypothetical protein
VNQAVNTVLAEHVNLGRRAIRLKQFTLEEMADKWGLDPDEFWVGLSAANAAVAEPPLAASEVLLADPRNASLSGIAPTQRDGKILCGVPGCGRPHRGRGYCMAHFKRLTRDGDAQVDVPIASKQRPTGQSCATPGCANPVVTRRNTIRMDEARIYCARCYRNFRDRETRKQGRRREVVFA